MTDMQKNDIIETTNPVLTDAPTDKEENTDMSGAKITALYCRLSQEDERLGDSVSIENQKNILLSFAKQNRFSNPTFFVDDGYSGTNFDRPGFQKMLAEIEAGNVALVITKDLSRLGRNQAMLGLYQNFIFPENGVWYIAINDSVDTIDPSRINNDYAGIKNWFNEFYARDTSRKIRATKKSMGDRGIPLATTVPYGYMKDPQDHRHWLIDPEAAEVVRHIFDLCMEGRGPGQIATQLTAEQILIPSTYRRKQGLNSPVVVPVKPCLWSNAVVADILERKEYTSCLINFKTHTNSIWDKKRRENPQEEQLVFPNHHEAIIEEAVFDRVQEIRQQRHRRTATGASSIFSGLVFCADCGARMQYSASNNYNTDHAFFDCSTHRNKRKDGCKGHFIREEVLKEVVLQHMQMVTGYILRYEDYFRAYMRRQRLSQSQDEIRSLKKQLERHEKRIEELKRLFIKVYEDNAGGRLSNDRYNMLSESYEIEQKALEAEVLRLQESIQVQENQNESIEQFIQTAKQHVGIEKLDGYILHEMIAGIDVGAPDKSSGHRTQAIHIRYNGIGFIPVNELMQGKTA